ncbi:MAG: hypothetical protein QF408_08755 [Pirellulales bacterium]|nr:hypothetical protein [Pirellulales bacterium]HJN64930.1 hypothetical protein [Pirellulales bacterium]
MRIVVAVTILCMMGAFAFHWADTPIGKASCGEGNNCATCHKNSAPRTHSAEFIEAGHGPAAHLNRQQCLDCHQQESCQDCHLKTPPSWHTEAFRQPACGWRQRDEHALIATSHRAACSECHAQRFQEQCASCHRPDEEDLELRFLD